MNDVRGIPSELSPRRKHAVLVSASLVTRSETALSSDLKLALEEAFSASELVELILQSLLFDGYPCALEGLITLREIVPSILPAEKIIESYSNENLELWIDRGEALCRRIYGDNFDRLLQNVDALSPTLKEWMLVEGYGRVLSRPELTIAVREMGIVAILTVKNLSRQLYSHLRGATRVGVTTAELKTAIHLCERYTEPARIESALNVWRKLP